MVDSNNKVRGEFNLKDELSALVAQKVIPLRVADRLETKLKEKNVELTKDQLRTLAYKIRDVLKEYIESGKINGKDGFAGGEFDQNMQKLVEAVEDLQERISNIESGGASYPKTVTTDDIRVPGHGWEIDPLTEIRDQTA